MRKLPALFFGLMLVICFVYLLLGIQVSHHSVSPLLANRPNASLLWVLGFPRNTTLKKPLSFSARQQTNTTRPRLTGAIRHYKSLLDSQPVTLNCSSCALVSSSGFILGKGAGEEIDHHSCVIRLNMAPVKGYERDVGTRTTLRVMNFFMIGVDPEVLPPGSRIMVWGLFRRTSYLEGAMNLTKRLSAGSTIHGQSWEGEVEAEELFAKETGLHPVKTKSWITTGWFAMTIALELCQQVHVYGMVPPDFCARKPKKDVPYHYYDQPWPKECSTYNKAERENKGGHRFITEKAVFARWALRYNLSFHSPAWDLNSGKLAGKLDTPFVNNQAWVGRLLQWFRNLA